MADSTLMIPAVGRIVHVYASHLSQNGVDAGPFAAIITQVFPSSDPAAAYVNVKVFVPIGPVQDITSIAQKGTVYATPGYYWEQPPRVDAF